MVVTLLFTAALGAIIGSFLNVVIVRLPLGQSIISPRSSCRSCRQTIASYDNIPVVSWLLLRGKCRHCREPISAQYPLIELVAASLAVTAVLVFGVSVTGVSVAVLSLTLVAVTMIDVKYRIIPNKILLVATCIALVLLVIQGPSELLSHLLAAVVSSGVLFIVVLVNPGGMGMGDVKLTFTLGLFLGSSVAVALFVAFFAGSIIGAFIIAKKGLRAGRKIAVPFAPFLALGGLYAAYLGDRTLDLYLK